MTYHLTGEYPHWWEGRRFSGPIDAWAAGTTAQTTRDIIQAALLGRLTPEPGGDPNDPIGLGTGMIPLRCIRNTRPRPGSLRDAIETVYVRHVSGGTSILSFKSFEQGRPSFEGTAKHVVWLDEEGPDDIYVECLTRTMTTDGIIYLTFTPVKGITETVTRFLPPLRVD
jgi:phage terminase large subunit-like protein